MTRANRFDREADGAEPAQGEADVLYRDGVAAALSGKRAVAEQLLRASVALDPGRHRAWLWLAGVVKDPRESLQYLEHVLELVPDEPHAREGARWVRQKLGLAGETPPPTAPLLLAAGTPPRSIPAANREELERRLAQSPGLVLPIVGLTALLCLFVLASCMLSGACWPLCDSLLPAFQEWVSGWAGPTFRYPDLATTRSPFGDAAATPSPTTAVSAGATATPSPALAMSIAVAEAQENAGPPARPASPLPTVFWAPLQAPLLPTPNASARSPAFKPPWYPAPSPLAATMRSGWRTPTYPWDQQGRQKGKWIEVDLSEQVLRAYEDDVPVMVAVVSTGKKSTPTVTGSYRIRAKYLAIDMVGPGYYLRAVPHAMFFHQGYAIHGTYWHSDFGRPASHGCINMAPEDARWLFAWTDPQLEAGGTSVQAGPGKPGTRVEIHE